MPDPFWILLAAKMTTTAIIVVAASKVVERLGPFLGAMVATLPRALPIGTYLLKWHVVAADQHRIEGSYTFKVK